MTPVDVGEATFELRTIGRASPWRLWSEVEVAFANGVAARIRPALEVLAVAAHWHGSILPEIDVVLTSVRATLLREIASHEPDELRTITVMVLAR